jgi:cell wall-associated NlpC family hydrolase
MSQQGMNRAVNAAKMARIVRAAMAAGLKGAAVEAARSFLPQIIKYGAIALIVLLLLPILIISALPSVLFGWSEVPAQDLKDRKTYAETMEGHYKKIEDYRADVVEEITDEHTKDGAAPTVVDDGGAPELYWIIGIDGAKHEQDVYKLNKAEIKQMIRESLNVSTETKDGKTTLTLSTKPPEEIMDAQGFNDQQKNWARLLYNTMLESQDAASGAPDYSGDPGAALGDGSYAALLAEGEKHLGKRYVYGASGPDTFDCSGFICWIFTKSGVRNLPRTTAQGIYNQCAPVRAADARPGDLIFFQGTYSHSEKVTHIGLYVGGGRMLHCGSPIQYASVGAAYWREHLYAYGRLS